MTTSDEELLQLIDRILTLVGDEDIMLDRLSKTADGQKVIQYVVQIGKYNTNLGEGKEVSIGDQLDRSVLEEIRDLLRSQVAGSSVDIDWQQVSRSLLNEQIQRLTTNPLTHAEGIAYRTEQVYVPLGLVERRRPSRRMEDVSPEQGSLLYEETEITQKFEHGAFLEEVLRLGRSPRSGGRRIAVIGEPGAGKTTLLQQVARWVSENIEGAIAIWVSLADLQGQLLEEYLLEWWLQAVVQQGGRARASTEVRDAFVAQVQAGRVWLFLDGVDEMAVAAGNPLGEMARQVKLGGLLSQIRIVLTCRLNLWDGDRHSLDSFDVYRTLEFAYPGQVEQFVGQWFGALPEAQEGQANRLREALRQPRKERLRDLVKNPLRLTLLCFNWYLREGTLPETKAEFYEQFVADFYEWKRELFLTTGEQRRRLNAALGELAREAIDQEETRFRLRHDFVCEFLGDPDEPNSLFQLALRLGWLNQVGVDSENRRKAVYAFFHPTFQEYFAALAIDDWHFFLNHTPHNPEQGKYLVFESLWQEVILLWLGRPYLQVCKEQKDAFIKALINFDDACQWLYWYRAYLLSTICISEFIDCDYADEIIKQIVKWAFGYFDSEQKNWKIDSIVFKKDLSLIQGKNTTKLKTELLSLLNFLKNKEITTDISRSNGIVFYDNLLANVSSNILKIDSSNWEALSTIEILINDSPLFQHLKGIKNHELLIAGTMNFPHRNIGNEISDAEEININNLCSSEEILDLVNSLAEIEDSNSFNLFVTLDKSITGNSNALPPLIEIIEGGLSPDFMVNKRVLFEAVRYIGRVGLSSTKAADSLMNLLLSNIDFGCYATRNIALSSLISVSFGNQEVFDFLIELIHEREDWAIHINSFHIPVTRCTAVDGLGITSNKDSFGLVVSNLNGYLQDESNNINRMFKESCYATLFRCAQNMSYPNFYRVWHS